MYIEKRNLQLSIPFPISISISYYKYNKYNIQDSILNNNIYLNFGYSLGCGRGMILIYTYLRQPENYNLYIIHYINVFIVLYNLYKKYINFIKNFVKIVDFVILF